MILKNKNRSEKNAKIKRRLATVGVYTALAATVLLITSNSVKKILNSADSIKIPEFDTTPQKISLSIPTLDGNKTSSTEILQLPEQKDIVPQDIAVSENPSDVTAQITEPEDENVAISGEPEDVEEIVIPPANDLDRFNDKKPPDVMMKPASGYISREFSRDELIYTPTMNDFRTHDGVDIAGDIGSPVTSFADGVIEDIYDDPFMGTTVVIRHSGGLVSCYSNLSSDLPQTVAVGNIVSVGAVVGGIGESAIVESAEVPHVHFELYKDEICVNPEDYFS